MVFLLTLLVGGLVNKLIASLVAKAGLSLVGNIVDNVNDFVVMSFMAFRRLEQRGRCQGYHSSRAGARRPVAGIVSPNTLRATHAEDILGFKERENFFRMTQRVEIIFKESVDRVSCGVG